MSAGNLMGALIHPIELSRPEKLVYSGHIYPFSPIISDLDYPLFKSLMHTMQVSLDSQLPSLISLFIFV